MRPFESVLIQVMLHGINEVLDRGWGSLQGWPPAVAGSSYRVHLVAVGKKGHHVLPSVPGHEDAVHKHQGRFCGRHAASLSPGWCRAETFAVKETPAKPRNCRTDLSPAPGKVAHMFDSADAVDAVNAMTFAARCEARAIAERLAAIARLYAIRKQTYLEAGLWRTDVFEAVGAEVSAAQNISRGRAASQVRMAVALQQRLPRVVEAFRRGDIDFRMVKTTLTCTDNVEDDVIADLDEALAPKLARWMRLSDKVLKDRLDQWVAKFDPAGVRVPPIAKNNRHFDVEPATPGMAYAGGVLNAEDAAAFDQRLKTLIATVCANDPRTENQLRADACGAMGRWETSLVCQCGADDCPATTLRDSAAQVVIHILAEQATLDGASDHPGYMSGMGILPADEVRKAAKTAKLKPVHQPGADPESGYRPSARLSDYLRWRDLTCRFPGCDAPVEKCDVDHTTPWPFGVTHASATKHYCRTHHLIKTFYTGPNGWRDEQYPDGTVVLTAPTGHVYVTDSAGGMLFPALAAPTATLPKANAPEESPDKSAMMPRRKRTREQDRASRIRRERQKRIEINAEKERQHQAWLAEIYEPPPF